MTGYRKCVSGSSEKCISASQPCLTDLSPCPAGRTMCGDECAPDHYLTTGYKKECGGACTWGRTVCNDGGDQCQRGRMTKCGDICIMNNHYSNYGYRECNGKCTSGSDKCCPGTQGSMLVLTTTPSKTQIPSAECCAEGYFTCGKECRLD